MDFQDYLANALADVAPALDLLLPQDTSLSEQLTLETLLDQGFTWEEGVRLLIMRDGISRNVEYQEHVLLEHPHLLFARWLYRHGVISG